MKRAYLLVETQTEANFLHQVLTLDELKDVSVVVAGGDVLSLARSLVAMRRVPVAVLMDADSLNPEVIEERRGGAEGTIMLAAASVPVKVVACVPNLDMHFFVVPAVIERLMGTKLSEDMVTLGRRDPQGVLQLLEKTSKRPWNTDKAIDVLSKEEIERIRQTPAVQELSDFLESLQPTAATS